jgi:TonB family protein
VDTLRKGTYWSLAIHVYVIGMLFLTNKVLSRLDFASPAIAIRIGGGGSAGGSPGAGGGASAAARDVSDIIEERPAVVAKASAARRTQPQASAQQSPTGPAVLAPTKEKKSQTTAKETQEERLERIRRSARRITPPPKTAATRNANTAAADPKTIRDRLLSGVSSAAGSSGSGGGRGAGAGSGSGGGGSGLGSGSGSGDGGGGSGHGSGGGTGDETGPGNGPGDPFYTAIGAALHDAWEPPSRAEVGGGNPVVGVKITLRSDGTVTAFQISRASGCAPMNQSVEALLRSLRSLPAPASFGFREAVKVIEVRFTLESIERG